MEFKELNLHPDLQKGLNEAEYFTCMPVQEQVLARAFGGQDLYVQSQTGTGKTAAYLVVIFQRLLSEDMLHGKKAIIMVPTRELAVQVEEEAKVIGKYLPFKIASFYGGVGYTQQTAMLRNNAQILVGTPGRVLDLNQSGHMNLMDIAFLILDEADRMFDMGFYPDLRKLIRAVPPVDRRQTMLFSATLNAWVKNLAWEYTSNPFEIAIEPETVTVEEVEQLLYHVASSDKMKLLLGILKKEDPESAIIFCNTKRYAEIVARRLRMNGYECEFIMGDLPQPKRLKIIENIKAGKLRILVATDVAARGLDIEDLSLVINYDIPNEAENYVHRIGRTARAGKTGKAFSIASEQDVYELPAIERYIGGRIPSENASAELLAEDSSEGKQIRSDFYESRRSDSRDSRREARSGKSRRGESRREEFRQPSGAGDEAPRSGDARRDARRDERSDTRRDNRRGNQRGKQRPDRAANQSRDSRPERRKSKPVSPELQHRNLSEMSLEERMAYYKEKYDNAGQGSAASQQGQGKRRQDNRKPRNEARQGTASNAMPREEQASQARASQTVDGQPGEEKAGKKQGFFARLFGGFKKKGEQE